MSHTNISIFVPHFGCKNLCSFCNQNLITGTTSRPSADDVDRAVAIAITSKNYNPLTCEIAFFGGSFTAIEREYMDELLNAASKYVVNGTVRGVRISTRPDAIDTEILSHLKKNGVTAIELGAQSMDNEVLRINNRGHQSEDIVKASTLINAAGFELGLQMMTGLYGDTNIKAIKTANELIELKPKTIRIYPCIVLKNTDLERLFRNGDYKPQTLEEAVMICAELIEKFLNSGIEVIRVGLHSVNDNDFVAGPWHPAFRELCEGEIYLRLVKEELGVEGNYEILVPKTDISKMVGQKKCNIEHLRNLGYNCRVIGVAIAEKFSVRVAKI